MISPKLWGRVATRFLDENAPAVLSGIAIVGASTIGYLTYRATNQAVEVLTAEYAQRDRMTPSDQPVLQLSQVEKLKLTWHLYLPPAGVTILTIGAIVGSHHISAKRAAGLAAAYAMSERAYEEYREKVIEKFKPTKDQQVRDEIAQDRVTANPPEGSMLVISGTDQLVMDQPSDRYFHSTVEDIRSAENDGNQEILKVGIYTLEMFYASLGLKPTPWSHELGWDDDNPIDIKFSTALTPDKRPCIVISYNPIMLTERKHKLDQQGRRM